MPLWYSLPPHPPCDVMWWMLITEWWHEVYNNIIIWRYLGYGTGWLMIETHKTRDRQKDRQKWKTRLRMCRIDTNYSIFSWFRNWKCPYDAGRMLWYILLLSVLGTDGGYSFVVWCCSVGVQKGLVQYICELTDISIILWPNKVNIEKYCNLCSWSYFLIFHSV